MAISLVTLLDTFLTWMNKTNEVITVSNLATEGQLNSSGTLTLTNAGGVGGGISLNVSSGLIKGDGGLISNVRNTQITGTITNSQLVNDNIRMSSNTSAITLVVSGPGANANLGSIVYLNANVVSTNTDTSTTNIASANIVNAIHTLAVAAFTAANSGASSAAAFDKANAANVLAYTAGIDATYANGTAAAAYTAANNNTGGGYYKGNRGTVGNANNIGDIFRLNYLYLTANVTIDGNERGVAVGPLTVNTGYTLTVNSGGRIIII